MFDRCTPEQFCKDLEIALRRMCLRSTESAEFFHVTLPSLQTALAEGKQLCLNPRLTLSASEYCQYIETDSWEVRQCSQVLAGILDTAGTSPAAVALIKKSVKVSVGKG